MTAKIEKQGAIELLVIAIPIAPTASKTGKSTIIAGTGGFLQTNLQHNGKPVRVSVNAITGK